MTNDERVGAGPAHSSFRHSLFVISFLSALRTCFEIVAEVARLPAAGKSDQRSAFSNQLFLLADRYIAGSLATWRCGFFNFKTRS
jgi:hypothetical protein